MKTDVSYCKILYMAVFFFGEDTNMPKIFAPCFWLLILCENVDNSNIFNLGK